VIVTCFAAGWFVLLADEYKQLGKHIAGGAGFVANFMFWQESGYFDNAADTKPLLHLWSLGIEEQFYIVWPLLLWFAWQQRLNLLTLTCLAHDVLCAECNHHTKPEFDLSLMKAKATNHAGADSKKVS
jgi:peptidoglycan/LPS O-acetylase OafA/YrhL